MPSFTEMQCQVFINCNAKFHWIAMPDFTELHVQLMCWAECKSPFVHVINHVSDAWLNVDRTSHKRWNWLQVGNERCTYNKPTFTT